MIKIGHQNTKKHNIDAQQEGKNRENGQTKNIILKPENIPKLDKDRWC